MRFLPIAILVAVAAPALAAPATNADLCRSQLELLLSGRKLTSDEAATFKAQCDCLEQNPNGPCTESPQA
jgi:hypothetical protein